MQYGTNGRSDAASVGSVVSSCGRPVSAKQNLPAPRWRGLFLVCQFLALLLVFGALLAEADSLEESARVLARRAATEVRGETTNCQVRSLAHLDSAQLAAFSSAFEDELQKRGVKIASGGAQVSLTVTITRDAAGYIGVVQVEGREAREPLIMALGPVGDAAPLDTTFSYSLHKELLFSQDRPLVDVVFDDAARTAFALGLQEINSYERSGGGWSPSRSERLPVHRYSNRDPHGLLTIAANGSAMALLPGETCRLTAPDLNRWSCEPASTAAAAPVSQVASVEEATTDVGISAATWDSAGKTHLVTAGLDGQARLYEGSADPVAVFQGWGSQVTAINSGCGSGWQLLVTGKGDWTKSDDVRAMEIRERTAVSVSAPTEFNGPIVALRTPRITASGIPENSSAIAIERNLQTGRYEAYRLTLSCTD